jgi:signal transduction histidine kinase
VVDQSVVVAVETPQAEFATAEPAVMETATSGSDLKSNEDLIEPSSLERMAMSPLAEESVRPSLELATAGRWEAQYRDLASLAGGLAHEIRNPLGTIAMNVQLLAEDLSEPKTQFERRMRQKMEVVSRECQRLGSILDDFLRFAGVIDLDGRPISLNDLVGDVLEFSRPRIESKGIVLREDLQGDLPAVWLDGDLWRQALLNLLLNAESASRPGDELMVRTRLHGETVVVDVIDTGHGMSEEVRAKVFRPFFSTRAGGTGLGLPTAKRIVESHGGSILLNSEPSRGTAIQIRLPVSGPPC